MGQRGKSALKPAKSPRREAAQSARPALCVFATDFGWFGMTGRDSQLVALTIGHADPDEVRRAAARRRAAEDVALDFDESDWNPKLRRRLEGYTRGARDDFRDVAVALPAMTDFQQRIVAATRGIGYGNTLSYGELAAEAGSPRAARAVGNVMASNRVPIVIPCHRVIASGEKMGGFSAPQGVGLKRRMLSLEAETMGR